MRYLVHAALAIALIFSGARISTAAQPDLNVKIGQMIMVGFRGLYVNADHAIVRDINERHIGGVILFDYDVPTGTYGRNIESEQQLKALTASLQAQASIPLFIAVDQEGGKVSRLKEVYGFPPSISAARLGENNDLNETARQAQITAALLARTGINLNLAPVVDLNTNPRNPVIGKYERSFSKNPQRVAKHAQSVVEAHHRHGILTTLKHFPGQGSAHRDTQKGFTDVTQFWSARELEPFRLLIQAGQADLIMTGHIVNRKLDPAWCSTLSKKTVTDLLRGDMGFDGVVISDDLQMKAISETHISMEAAVVQAVMAGVDLLILANNSVFEEDAAQRAEAAIKEAIRKGILSNDRIDQSWGRIEKLKARLTKASAGRATTGK